MNESSQFTRQSTDNTTDIMAPPHIQMNEGVGHRHVYNNMTQTTDILDSDTYQTTLGAMYRAAGVTLSERAPAPDRRLDRVITLAHQVAMKSIRVRLSPLVETSATQPIDSSIMSSLSPVESSANRTKGRHRFDEETTYLADELDEFLPGPDEVGFDYVIAARAKASQHQKASANSILPPINQSVQPRPTIRHEILQTNDQFVENPTTRKQIRHNEKLKHPYKNRLSKIGLAIIRISTWPLSY